jgi:site-specific recombinase XerC
MSIGIGGDTRRYCKDGWCLLQLTEDLVLYCARHDYGAFVLSKTGNLKAVINAMGQIDVKSAMVYQHPELEIVRDAINSRHIERHTVKTSTR